MDSIKLLFHSVFGPRLFQIFAAGAHQHVYQANRMELTGDKILQICRVVYGLAYYCWPVMLPYLYRKGLFDVNNLNPLFRVASIAGGILAISYSIRGIGRFANPEYCAMLEALFAAQKSRSDHSKKILLLQFDTSMEQFPVNFQAERTRYSPPEADSYPAWLVKSVFTPYSTLTSVLAAALGRPMMYPGSTGFINLQLSRDLMSQRYKMIVQENGARRVLGAVDGNKIDSMFFDRRGTDSEDGNTLVIASDGNAAYYEVGATVMCKDTGYSVLGWNHPGFGASTGLPFPAQEQNAAEAVFQYAVKELGFPPENIILYSWSIGGYAASFLAETHQDISGVIMDATFDDIVPLACNHMPAAISPFVKSIVQSHLHLNNVERLNNFNGPVMVVRRSLDQMMMTDGKASSNRGNFLFKSIFSRRYPHLMCDVTETYFTRLLQREFPHMSAEQVGGDPKDLDALLSRQVEEHGTGYPNTIGCDMSDEEKKAMAAHIASKMLRHYRSTHCVALPSSFVTKPWSLKDHQK